MSLRRRRWITLAVVAIGLALLAFWMLAPSRSADGQPEDRYYTRPAERAAVRMEVSATGTLNPVNQVEVGAQITGRVSSLHADYNSVVEKGQIVAELDPTFLDAQLKEAEANLARAQAEARQRQKDHERAQSLAARNLISTQELEAARTAFDVTQAAVKQAQAAADRADTNLRYATIRSPVSGVVLSRRVDVGQTVAASLQAPVLFVIAEDLTRMQLETNIDEADIGRIRTGQEVEFTVDAYPEDKFRGSVTQIRLEPIDVQNVVTYPVIISVENPDLKLRPGMTANVSVTVAEEENALAVPSAALRFKPEGETAGGSDAGTATGERRASGGGSRQRSSGGQGGGGGATTELGARIYVLRDGQAQPVAVKVGLDNGTLAQIVAGDLQEGSEVITGLRRPEERAGNSAGLFNMARFRGGR